MSSLQMADRVPSTRSKYIPWLIVLGVIGCYSIPVGMIGNTAGIFVQPVMDEFGWDQTSTTMYRTIQPLVAAVCTPFAGQLMAKYNARVILTITSILFGVASLGTAFATALWQWNLYGVIYGVTCAFFMYLASPLLVNRWFAKDAGKVLGVISAVLSLIAAVSTPLAQRVINESGWQDARFWLCGIATVLSVVLSVIFLRNDPKSMGLLPWGATECDQTKSTPRVADAANTGEDTESQAIRESSAVVVDESSGPMSSQAAVDTAADVPGAGLTESLRSPGLYLIFVITSFIVMTTAFFQQIPVYAAQGPLGADAGAMAVSIVMVGGILGKLLLGWMADRTGIKTAAQFSQACGAVGILLVYLAHGSVSVFYIGMGIFGFGYASLTVVVPLLVRHAFGMKNYAKIFSWVSTIIFLATSISFVLYGRIADLTGSFDLSFYLVIGMYVISTLLIGPALRTARSIWSTDPNRAVD